MAYHQCGVSRILFLLRCNVFTVPESIPACYRFPFLLLPSLRPSPLKPHERYVACVCVTRQNSRERASERAVRSLESRFTDPRVVIALAERACLRATVDSCSLTFSVSIQGVPRPQSRLSPGKDLVESGNATFPGRKITAEAPSRSISTSSVPLPSLDLQSF